MSKKINIQLNNKHAQMVLSGLSEGFTLSEVLEANEELPPRRVIASWRQDNEEFEAAYRLASKIRTERWVDDLKSLAKIDIDEELPKEDKYFELQKLQFKANTLKYLIAHSTKMNSEKVLKEQPSEKSANNIIQIINYDEANDIKQEMLERMDNE